MRLHVGGRPYFFSLGGLLFLRTCMMRSGMVELFLALSFPSIHLYISTRSTPAVSATASTVQVHSQVLQFSHARFANISRRPLPQPTRFCGIRDAAGQGQGPADFGQITSVRWPSGPDCLQS